MPPSFHPCFPLCHFSFSCTTCRTACHNTFRTHYKPLTTQALPDSVVESYESLLSDYGSLLRRSDANGAKVDPAARLFDEYDAFSTSFCLKQFHRTADPKDDIQAFRSYLTKQDGGNNKLKRSGNHGVVQNTPNKMAKVSSMVSPPSANAGGAAAIGASNNKGKAVSLSPPKAKYTERKGAGTTVSRYAPADVSPEEAKSFFDSGDKYGLENSSGTVQIDWKETFKGYNVEEPFRYMFTPTAERARALDDHLVNLARGMYESNPAMFPAPTPVGVPVVSGEDVQLLGRICNEVREEREKRREKMEERRWKRKERRIIG